MALVSTALPQGIREASPEQARELEATRRLLLNCFQSYGYELVAPPLLEFLDTLVGDNDSLAEQTLTVTDPVSGRMLGVRADMTAQIARMDSRYIAQDRIARLCYIGQVVRAKAEVLGGGRNPIQVGAELYGDAGVGADAEIVQLLCEALRVSGCAEVCLALGHTGVFRALAEQAQWDASQRHEVFDILQRKAVVELEAWLKAHPLEKPLEQALRALPEELSGAGEEVLDRAESLLQCVREPLTDALNNLRTVARQVRQCCPDIRLHFDLGEANGFHYESGLVFAAYTEGQGQEIARGGRYAGRDQRPATGFSLDLRTLVDCRLPQTVAPRRIYAPMSDDPAQRTRIEALRAEGCSVIQSLEGGESASANGCTEQLVCVKGTWEVSGVDS